MPTRIKGESSDERIERRIAEHRGEIARMLEEVKTADKAEKEELRAKIKVLEDHIAEEQKAKDEKEKKEGTGGTLVLPPEQVPQGQHHDSGQHEPTPDQSKEPGKKRGRWKRAW